MIHVAILGFGVVGSGVAEVMSMNHFELESRLGEPIAVKKILDIRDFPDSPFHGLFTKDPADIFDDPEITVVAETIGGATIAYDFTKEALKRGKSVVTSNKELVARHGVELMQLAEKNQCVYLFEASVGGGIPIIRPLHRCLAANRISRIVGIVNGTTNYILTQMTESGADFETALSEAKAKGYAEQNPGADIDGIDAKRKLAILGSIVLNGDYIDSDAIYTEGITKITQDEITYAKALGGKVKLLAILHHPDHEKATAIVAPHIVDKTDPIAVADGVFNAICVRGNALGDAMFYGQGAGKLATASAVVGDVLDAALHQERSAHITVWHYADHPLLLDHNETLVKALIRVKEEVSDSLIAEHLQGIHFEKVPTVISGEKAYLTGSDGSLTEAKLEKAKHEMPGFVSYIRVF